MGKVWIFNEPAVIADHTGSRALFLDPLQQVHTISMESRSAMAGMCLDGHPVSRLYALDGSLRTNFNDHAIAPLFQLQLFLFTDQAQNSIDLFDLLFAQI